MHRLMERLEQFGSPAVALVGDFMLDRYVYGDAERMSQEAPVPVLRVRSDRTEQRVGGAGNVAVALRGLGVSVSCLGAVGDDRPGAEVLAMLADAAAGTDGIVSAPDRPTSRKTRYVGLAQHRHPQHIIRVDEENGQPLSGNTLAALQTALETQLPDIDVVALEDYNKGVLTDDTTPQLIATARSAGKPVLVDPALLEDYSRYRGATLLTPNRYEASVASGVEITDDETLAAAGRRLLSVTEADAVLITLDREGMAIASADGLERVWHAQPRSVYDITGAGDMVLAVLSLAVAEGAGLVEAAQLANVAGGLEVERFGVVPVSREEMLQEIGRQVGLRGSKTLSPGLLAGELERRRGRGETVVFTNGCFDLLHVGHVKFLQQARELGSCLVVAINSDASVSRIKGEGRPVLDVRQRQEILAAMECVDYVTVFDEDTPLSLVELLKPDVLVKGSVTKDVVGRELVERYGGEVVTTPPLEGVSTSEIISRISGQGGA
jgi:D-beta-D-heptose 7-phosphate kinase/D-beta-D-heptose 1-phosphate adenosyltransferase